MEKTNKGNWGKFCSNPSADPKDYITLQDILYWIMDNSDDEEAMTKINRSSYIFTSRYKQGGYGN